MTKSLTESVQQAVTTLNAQIDAISSDPAATPRAQRARAARAYTAAKAEVDRLRATLTNERTASLNTKRQKALDPASDLPFASLADRTAVRMSYRDALARLGELDRDQQLEQLQTWAAVDDHVALKAVMATAFEKRDVAMINKVLEHAPQWDKAANEYWDAITADNADLAQDLKAAVVTTVPIPPMLDGLTVSEIEHLASDEQVA